MSTLTLLDKIWNCHTVTTLDDGSTLLFIDCHFVHEVTSPQAFASLCSLKRKVRRPDLTFATIDHCIPTLRPKIILDPVAKTQVMTLVKNCRRFGIELFDLDSGKQGIVHVIGPELGITLPGQTIVCGDSHTATHGAFGALAFGIGTSEVEHVLATQCLVAKKPKSFLVEFAGKLPKRVSAKDMALALIRKIGTGGATGHAFEFCGKAISDLSMDARMTLCSMSIEAGARAGLVAPDQTTFAYFVSQTRAFAPKGTTLKKVLKHWFLLRTDPKARFDATIKIDISALAPQVTWGTSPGMVMGINEPIPEPGVLPHVVRNDHKKALTYMGLKAGQRMTEVKVDAVFIGSCTNGRLEDLQKAAGIMKGKMVHSGVSVWVVPGSQTVKREAEKLGLDRIFKAAGAQWRDAGCSFCLSMNPDQISPQMRCASTSNRNFEGRQGPGSRTHLVSPEMAAAAAIAGRFVDVRNC